MLDGSIILFGTLRSSKFLRVISYTPASTLDRVFGGMSWRLIVCDLLHFLEFKLLLGLLIVLKFECVLIDLFYPLFHVQNLLSQTPILLHVRDKLSEQSRPTA
jgi:hypothetical protein